MYIFATCGDSYIEGNGDSPANVQGGIVVGAIMLRCLLPHIDWAVTGLEGDSVMTSQGFTLVGVVAACILLFPMPLNSRGEILFAASTCYRRMWRTFFYMLFFAAGSVWRRSPDSRSGSAGAGAGYPTTPMGWVGVVAAKFVIGHAISQFSVWAISYVAQLFVECCLRLYVKYVKPAMVGVWDDLRVTRASRPCPRPSSPPRLPCLTPLI
jgi:hypothetical protein